MPEPIKRYEYETIAIGEQGFTEEHFNSLVLWNERNGGRYFEVGHRKLKCKQFVGVVQVGRVVIEILPKAERASGEAEKHRWRNALLTMLGKAYGLRLHASNEADLALRRTDLMDLFLDAFVKEVRSLVHAGLVKKYHAKPGNQLALKGRLDFPRHLCLNLVHKERFAVVHQAYDTDHILHSILKEALNIVERTCNHAGITGRAQDVNWAFDAVQPRMIDAATFAGLRLERKTVPYARALQLAKLIILQYSPDLRSGREPVLSILFDMEKLWEKFIHRVLAERCTDGWSLESQEEALFWEQRTMRPDLVFAQEGVVRLIADTKWKVPQDDEPSLEDLRQMFAYNIRFVSERSVLLYPGTTKPRKGNYVNHDQGWYGVQHGCEVRFVMPFDERGALCPEHLLKLSSELLRNELGDQAVIEASRCI